MIFCVEDDKSIRDLVIYTLSSVGYEAAGFASGKELFAALEATVPQLIMLDIMLPEEDGLSILKKLKNDPRTEDIPVIMATAKGTEYDKVIGLDLGADDYLAKPFGMMEIISRVKAVLRRAAPKKDDSVLKKGDLELDEKRHEVRVHGTPVQLTLKEYELLHIFMKNLGIVFSRDRLLSSVWGIDFVGESRTVDVHIGTLRTKLGDCGDYIETVRGVGYKMEDKK